MQILHIFTNRESLFLDITVVGNRMVFKTEGFKQVIREKDSQPYLERQRVRERERERERGRDSLDSNIPAFGVN